MSRLYFCASVWYTDLSKKKKKNVAPLLSFKKCAETQAPTRSVGRMCTWLLIYSEAGVLLGNVGQTCRGHVRQWDGLWSVRQLHKHRDPGEEPGPSHGASKWQTAMNPLYVLDEALRPTQRSPSRFRHHFYFNTSVGQVMFCVSWSWFVKQLSTTPSVWVT